MTTFKKFKSFKSDRVRQHKPYSYLLYPGAWMNSTSWKTRLPLFPRKFPLLRIPVTASQLI